MIAQTLIACKSQNRAELNEAVPLVVESVVDLDPENPVEKVPAEPQRPKGGCPAVANSSMPRNGANAKRTAAMTAKVRTVRDVRKHVGAQQRGDDEKTPLIAILRTNICKRLIATPLLLR